MITSCTTYIEHRYLPLVTGKKKEKKKANKRSTYRTKGKVPFESLLSVLTDTQAGKKMALWGRKEEKVQPFFLFIMLLKSVEVEAYNSSGSNLESLRCMGLHWETKLGENKQPWLPAVFPEIWKLGITSSPPIRKSARRNPEVFLS